PRLRDRERKRVFLFWAEETEVNTTLSVHVSNSRKCSNVPLHPHTNTWHSTHTISLVPSLPRAHTHARTHARMHALTQNYFFKSTNHTKRFFSHNNTLTHSLTLYI